MLHVFQSFILISIIFRQSSSHSPNVTSAQKGSWRQLLAGGKLQHDELMQLKDTTKFLLAKTKHLTIANGSTVDGIRLHRAYAAAMRSDPRCARFVRPYPFHIPIGDGTSEATEAYARRLLLEAPPVVWVVQGGSGLGNGLWGFVLAFAQSLVTGRALVVAASQQRTLPSDYLCDAMECRYPRVDVSVAEKVPGVMISHGFQASAVNNVDPCLLRAVGCDKARGGPDRICFAAAALRSLLAGRMNKSYLDQLGPLLDRFVGDRRALEDILHSQPGPRKSTQHTRMLHVRTLNPASEAADLMETSARADIEKAIRHHTLNLNNALESTGMCTFSRPAEQARRLAAGFLNSHPLHHSGASAHTSRSSSMPSVFVASDSLELKTGLHKLHNRSAQALEWFNVTNAHISAISRSEDARGAKASSVARRAEFDLSKLMTMIEFYRICTIESVTATRLTLDTKSSESKKGWTLSAALSTFVETAAIVGGASVGICKSRGFGTSGSAEKIKGDKAQIFAPPRHMASAVAAAAGERVPVTVVVTLFTGKEDIAKIAAEAYAVFGGDAMVVVFETGTRNTALQSKRSGSNSRIELRTLPLQQSALASEICEATLRPVALQAAAQGLSDGTLLVWAAAPGVLSRNYWSHARMGEQNLTWVPMSPLESIAVSAQDNHGLFGTTDSVTPSPASISEPHGRDVVEHVDDAESLLELGPFSSAWRRNVSLLNVRGYSHEKARLQSLEGFIFMKRPGQTALSLPPEPPSFTSLINDKFTLDGKLIACIVGSPAWQMIMVPWLSSWSNEVKCPSKGTSDLELLTSLALKKSTELSRLRTTL